MISIKTENYSLILLLLMTWFDEHENIEEIDPKTYFSSYHHAEEVKPGEVLSRISFQQDFGHGYQRYSWDDCVVYEKNNEKKRHFKLAAVDASQDELNQLARFCPCPNCHPPRKFFFTGVPLSVLVILALNWVVYFNLGKFALALSSTICIYTAFKKFRLIYGIALSLMYCPCCYGCLRSDFPAQHHIIAARKKLIKLN